MQASPQLSLSPPNPFFRYDWICGHRAYIGSLYPQIQFAGVLGGTLLFGSLSDCVGRKPVAVFALSLGISAIVGGALAPGWQLLLAARFFVGLSIGGAVVVVCTFVMEMLLPEQRMALRAFFNWGWARLWLTGICYIFPDWRSSRSGGGGGNFLAIDGPWPKYCFRCPRLTLVGPLSGLVLGC